MAQNPDFDLDGFIPYLLNRAAEETSIGFQRYYKDHYGMLRTEWRVLFHLGRYGELTAKSICTRASLHKTKVSRAVSALEERRFLSRRRKEEDRRKELLALTKAGQKAFDDLIQRAQGFNDQLMAHRPADERKVILQFLTEMSVGKAK